MAGNPGVSLFAITRLQMDHPPTSGLALALGSSFLGYHAHAGFLNGLAAGGIVPEKISGTSAGAIAGSLFSAGLRGEALEKAALDPALRWSFLDAGMFHRLPGLITGWWSTGLLSGNRAIRHLRSLLGDRDLSALTAPSMEIAVTDADHHRPVVLKAGPLVELVVASCAVPGLIAVQRVSGVRYIDGGVACEVPFEHWLDDPAVETILIHRIHRQRKKAGPSRDSFHRAIGSVRRTVSGEIHRHRSELARLRGKRLVEIETITPLPGLFGSRKTRACYDLGYQSGMETARLFLNVT
ncbi:MAG: patatin-like phospholipase family protein [Verrucomicrobiota bacterium]